MDDIALDTSASPHRYPISIEMFHQMIEAGVIASDGRVELIEGELYELPEKGGRHARCVNFLSAFFISTFSGKFDVRVQEPIISVAHSQPRPDIAIVRRRIDRAPGTIPDAEDVVMIVEVSENTASFDRERKLPNYAAAGVPETWLVDLRAGCVEVHYGPTADGYNTLKIYRRGEKVWSETIPAVTLVDYHIHLD